jgi:hypothetical protein
MPGANSQHLFSQVSLTQTNNRTLPHGTKIAGYGCFSDAAAMWDENFRSKHLRAFTDADAGD